MTHTLDQHMPNLWTTLDKTSGATIIDAEVAAFSKANEKIVKASNTHSKSKLQEPDPFDGFNSWKLCTFMLKCKLNFQDCPDLFTNDIAKVNYTLSFLKCSALDCFEPALLDLNEHNWLSDFQLFIEELKNNFRTYDPVSEAEAFPRNSGKMES